MIGGPRWTRCEQKQRKSLPGHSPGGQSQDSAPGGPWPRGVEKRRCDAQVAPPISLDTKAAKPNTPPLLPQATPPTSATSLKNASLLD